LKVKWAVPSPGAPLSNALEIPSTR
jgi:hypothetical protein